MYENTTRVLELVKLRMTRTSIRRRSVIIPSIIIAVLVVASIGAAILYNQLTGTRISLDIATTQTEVVQGTSSQVQVYVISIGNPEKVTLSSVAGSSGIICTFEPASGESNFTSTLTYSVSDSVPTGKYPVTVTASSGWHEAKLSSVVLSVLNAKVTVSGRASSAAIMQPFFSSLIGIQFIDTQTGANSSFDFQYPHPPPYNPFGNYSVVLINEHTYAVTISYYWSPSANANFWDTQADYIGNFTVYARAEETAISNDFG